MVREATEADFQKIQGGKPRIEGNKVIHDYPGGEGMIVTGHKNPLKEKVTLDVDGEAVSFPARLLKEFHGQPCETLSKKEGGEGYERE